MLSPTASTAYLVRNHVQKELQLVEERSADLRRIHDRFLTTYYYTVLFFFVFDICSIYKSAGEHGELRAWRGFLIPRRGGFAQTLVAMKREQL